MTVEWPLISCKEMCFIKTYFFVCKSARILSTCKHANLITNNAIARPQISAQFSKFSNS